MAPFHGHNIPFLPCVNQGAHVGSAGWKSWAMRSAFSFLGADFEFQLSSAKHHGFVDFHLTLLYFKQHHLSMKFFSIQPSISYADRKSTMSPENPASSSTTQTYFGLGFPANEPHDSGAQFRQVSRTAVQLPSRQSQPEALHFSLVGTNLSYLIDSFLGFRTPPKQ